MSGGEKSLRLRVAANIRLYRHRLDWSQETLAHEAGLHRTYIGQVERGETNISIDNLERIAGAMKIDACQMICPDPVAATRPVTPASRAPKAQGVRDPEKSAPSDAV